MKKKLCLNKDNIKILVCCHKSCELPPDPDGIFLPIQVGAAISDVDLGMQRDDMVNGEPCDNISAKNKSYCELTALYWAWKNIKKLYPNLEYIGLNHYRRYFTSRNTNSNVKYFYFLLKNRLQFTLGKKIHFAFVPTKSIYTKSLGMYLKDLKTVLDKAISKGKKVFATKKCHLDGENVRDFFNNNGNGRNNIELLNDVIDELAPDYSVCFKKTLEAKEFHYGNMFIMSFDLFDKYCSYIFSVLDGFERKSISSKFYVDIVSERSAARLFGYFGEILTDSFIRGNEKSILHELNSIFVNDL